MFNSLWQTRHSRGGGTLGGGSAPLPHDLGRAECQVVGPQGLPMRATVTVLDHTGRPLTQCSTNVYGLFSVPVPPGDYHLAVACDGFRPDRRSVKVFPGTRSSAGVIDLTAAPSPPIGPPRRRGIGQNPNAIWPTTRRHLELTGIRSRFNPFIGTVWIDGSVGRLPMSECGENPEDLSQQCARYRFAWLRTASPPRTSTGSRDVMHWTRVSEMVNSRSERRYTTVSMTARRKVAARVTSTAP